MILSIVAEQGKQVEKKFITNSFSFVVVPKPATLEKENSDFILKHISLFSLLILENNHIFFGLKLFLRQVFRFKLRVLPVSLGFYNFFFLIKSKAQYLIFVIDLQPLSQYNMYNLLNILIQLTDVRIGLPYIPVCLVFLLCQPWRLRGVGSRRHFIIQKKKTKHNKNWKLSNFEAWKFW